MYNFENKIDDMRLSDLNNKMMMLDKKMSNLLYSFEYLTTKVNEIHNEMFSFPSPSKFRKNISPIRSPMAPTYRNHRIRTKSLSYSDSDSEESLALRLPSTPKAIAPDTAHPKSATYYDSLRKSPPVMTYKTIKKEHLFPDINKKINENVEIVNVETVNINNNTNPRIKHNRNQEGKKKIRLNRRKTFE